MSRTKKIELLRAELKWYGETLPKSDVWWKNLTLLMAEIICDSSEEKKK